MSTVAPVTDFSTPIYMDEPAAGASTPGDAALASSVVVDLNDPALLDQEFDTNADVNAYDAPPPIPDGRYKAKLKQIDVKGPNGGLRQFNVKTSKQGSPYAYTALEMTLIDPSGKYEGLKVYDRFVSTMQARNGGIPMARVLACLGVKLPAKTTAKQLLDAFIKATASEPMLEIETTWEGSLDEADRERFEQAGVKQPRVFGMNRFPANPDGKGGHLPEMDVDTALGKVHLRAQVRVQNYQPLSK